MRRICKCCVCFVEYARVMCLFVYLVECESDVCILWSVRVMCLSDVPGWCSSGQQEMQELHEPRQVVRQHSGQRRSYGRGGGVRGSATRGGGPRGNGPRGSSRPRGGSTQRFRGVNGLATCLFLTNDGTVE